MEAVEKLSDRDLEKVSKMLKLQDNNDNADTAS